MDYKVNDEARVVNGEGVGAIPNLAKAWDVKFLQGPSTKQCMSVSVCSN